jgi:toxin ParE1/3/4
MPRIIRSDAAEREVEAIAAYIAQDNLDAALRWIDAVDRRLELVAQFPMVGRSRHEFSQGLRSINLGEYLIFFRPIEGGIEFVHILHGKRQVEDLMREDER